jgi:alkaline phosphatase
MNKLKSIIPLIALSFAFSSCLTSTKDYTPADAHSHNDYKNSIPFYRAYDAGFGSIEADVFAVNGQLLVAHSEKEITPSRSLKRLYLDPLIEKFKRDTTRKLRLLIEIKKDYTITLPLVLEELKPLSQYFDYPGHAGRLSIVMTGAVPPGEVMLNYPAWLRFDVDHVGGFTSQQLTKIGLISVPFSRFSKWNGARDITQRDVDRLTVMIDSAHNAGKKIRFWDTPDNPTCWNELISLHADVIGTDRINQLAIYLDKKDYLN